jgi:hypothetical protein
MSQSTQFAEAAQVPLADEPTLLDDEIEIENPFWERNSVQALIEKMTLNSILMAWKAGAIGSVEAINSLNEYDLLDLDITMELLWGYYAAPDEEAS